MSEIKCSQDNPCQDCQEEQKKQLAKTEDWEVKKKEKLEKFEFMEAEFCNNRRNDGNKIQYSSFGDYSQGYSYENCPECGKEHSLFYIHKSNGYGDKTTYLKEKKCSCERREHQIKSNQIKSNQIKSNQIKSNQIKSNQLSAATQDNSNKNYLPWILGGVGVFALIAGLVWYFTRKEGK